MFMSIKGTRTEKNLLKAFAGESQAKNRYTFFAKQAKKDGYEQIAEIFALTALQEESHAKVFFRFMEGGPVEITATYPAGMIGNTADNLVEAANGENEEWTEIYSEFAAIAEEEGFLQIATAFKLVAKIEAEHEARFLKLLRNVEDNRVFESEETEEWVCRKCGYVHTGKKALENCPVCKHPKAYFEKKATNY
ncbi:MAG TPA: rubrerythrin family protein [Bacteroidales bacterium]|nr:rubrerythrin family protein [Bacteroidales bacterium]HQI69411.1 rubrerythrin family protein [Bacteroidales bacterium]